MATGARIEKPPRDGPYGSNQERSTRHGAARFPLIIGMVLLISITGAGWFTGAFGDAIWWLTNTTPPTLSLSGSTDVVRGPVAVAVQLAPRARIVTAQIDDRPLST